MTTVLINRFDGGKAEDVRTTSTNQHTESQNFDIYTNPHLLIPLRDTVDETILSGAAMDDIQISDVGVAKLVGTFYPMAFGYESSSSSAPAAYFRSSGTLNGAWSRQATGTGDYAKGTMVVYKEEAYVMNTAGVLFKYNLAGSLVSIGTNAGTGTDTRPFVHPEDNILYIVKGSVISKYDGTTFTSYSSILPSDMMATSITNYGTYLAISMVPISGNGDSKMYLWGRDGTINTLQGVINFGRGRLNVIENIDDIIVGIMYPQAFSGSAFDYKVDIKVWSGGAVETVKSIQTTDKNFNQLKLKKDSKLFFATGFTASCIWQVYRNKSGYWTVTQANYLNAGLTATNDLVQVVTGLSAIGDFTYMAFVDNVGNYKLKATSSNETYSATSTYTTTVNPNMPEMDRSADKKLAAAQVLYTGTSTGTVGLKVSVDGGAFTSIISKSTASGEGVADATAFNDGSFFESGREFTFKAESTNGVKIKEIKYKYDKLNSQI